VISFTRPDITVKFFCRDILGYLKCLDIFEMSVGETSEKFVDLLQW
jgi:hypothetical protein